MTKVGLGNGNPYSLNPQIKASEALGFNSLFALSGDNVVADSAIPILDTVETPTKEAAANVSVASEPAPKQTLGAKLDHLKERIGLKKQELRLSIYKIASGELQTALLLADQKKNGGNGDGFVDFKELISVVKTKPYLLQGFKRATEGKNAPCHIRFQGESRFPEIRFIDVAEKDLDLALALLKEREGDVDPSGFVCETDLTQAAMADPSLVEKYTSIAREAERDFLLTVQKKVSERAGVFIAFGVLGGAAATMLLSLVSAPLVGIALGGGLIGLGIRNVVQLEKCNKRLKEL